MGNRMAEPMHCYVYFFARELFSHRFVAIDYLPSPLKRLPEAVIGALAEMKAAS